MATSNSNSEQEPPQHESAVVTPHANDVFCGRGGASKNHEGNMNYHRVVDKNKKLYASLPKQHKHLLARSIVEAIKVGQVPPGRFLEKRKDDGRWYEIDSRVAIENTKQSLRETSIFGATSGTSISGNGEDNTKRRNSSDDLSQKHASDIAWKKKKRKNLESD